MTDFKFLLKRVDPVTGYTIAVIRHPEMGHFCGYVQVPSNHQWYKVNYHIKRMLQPFADLDPTFMNEQIEEELAMMAKQGVKQPIETDEPEKYIDCHGGITYSGFLTGDENHNEWWFGFDCSHYNDYNPGLAASIRLIYKDDPAKADERMKYFEGPELHRWSPEEVLDECSRMALQLKSHEAAHEGEDNGKEETALDTDSSRQEASHEEPGSCKQDQVQEDKTRPRDDDGRQTQTGGPDQ